ncbi:MAG: murein biosynthesis integral membrane protein MurJ [Candidatus Hamiltonella defensa (Ceratovacuna japonica)]
MKQESFHKSINASIFWRGLARLSGLTKHIIIAAMIGLNAQLDVFFMATVLLGILVFSWGEIADVMSVPHMVKTWKNGQKEEFKKIASGYMSFIFLGSLLLAFMVYLFSHQLSLLPIGFNPERKKLLAQSLPWLLPAVILYVPFRHMGAVLRSVRQFSPLYQGEFLLSLITMLCIVCFYHYPNVLFWSYSMGVTGAFLYLLCRTWRFVLPLSNPFSFIVRQSLVLAPGLMILQGTQYFYTFTDQFFVSFLTVGMVSALFYATIITYALPGLMGLDNAFITVIAEQSDKKERVKKMDDLLSLVIYLGFGATLLMIVAGKAIVALLLERGLFTVADTESVSIALMAYSGVILPFFLNKPFDQIFQVERKIRLMVWRTLLGLIANVILNSVFLFIFHWGIFGVALATSISYWVMMLASLQGLRKIGYEFDLLRALKWSSWLLLFLVFAYFGCQSIPQYFTHPIFVLISCALLIGLTLLLAGLIYQGKERVLIIAVIRRYKKFEFI